MVADKMWDILKFLKPSPEEELRDAANNKKKMELDSQLVEALETVEKEIERAEILEEAEPETTEMPEPEVSEHPIAEPRMSKEETTEEAEEETEIETETEATEEANEETKEETKEETEEDTPTEEPVKPTAKPVFAEAEVIASEVIEAERVELAEEKSAMTETEMLLGPIEEEVPAVVQQSLESLMRQESTPIADVAPELGRQLLEIDVTEIVPNPYQPRLVMEEEDITELAQSIREVGILQPILVKRLDIGYELIAGERRLRAAKEAGLATIPALVTEVDPLAQQLMALVENLQRKNLSAVEEGKCLQDILARTKWNQTDLAKRLGRSQAAVANKIRLLKLEPAVQQWVMEGKLGERQARTLLGFTAEEQIELGNRAIKEDLSVKELEALALVLQDRNPSVRKKTPKEKSPSNKDLENREILQDIAALVNKHRSKGIEANWKVRELAGETLVIEIVVDMRGNLVSEGESHADGI